jgi:hypothetical protein
MPLTALALPLSPSVQNGHIKRLTDADIQSSVLEIMSSNVSTTYITTPADAAQTLGIKVRRHMHMPGPLLCFGPLRCSLAAWLGAGALTPPVLHFWDLLRALRAPLVAKEQCGPAGWQAGGQAGSSSHPSQPLMLQSLCTAPRSCRFWL